MKKVLQITVLVLLLLNIVVPAFQSCTKDSSKTDNPALQVTLENLVATYNNGVMLEHEKAILMEGEMTIMTLSSKEVLFFLKKDDITTNDIFLGQGTELSSVIQKELGNVKVAYLREALVIETAAKEIYIFTIGERKGHELVQKLAPIWFGKGYGLSLNINRAEGPSAYKGLSSTDEIRASTCKCRYQEAGSDDSDCTAGGSGSTSCSIGASGSDPGCSVSCSEGHYSCCKTE